MKVIILSLFLVGCGWKNAYDDIHTLQRQQAEAEQRQQQLEARISLLEANQTALESDLQSSISIFNDNQASLQADLQALQTALNELQTEFSSTVVQLVTVQSQLAVLQGQVGLLNAEERVVRMLDPCGDMANEFDEVLLVTNSNKVIAYFETSGNKRFLSVLAPNQTYQTTDTQACVFSVNSAGQLN